jgi:predicted glycosyltransferase
MPIPEGWKMKIWYDACTGKHIRYGVAIARRLRSKGHKITLTTRKHPDTLPMAEYLEEKFVIVGRYDPRSLLTRLREGTRRQLSFCELFEKDLQDFAISHCSVDQCRVAFGLGTPLIVTADTPYADAVNRLSLPLASHIVVSKAIPREKIQSYGTKGEITGFRGVDEVAWIKGFEPKVKYDFGKPLIVVRQIEGKAAYATNKVDLLVLAKKLRKLGKIVFLSRYDHEAVGGLVVPKGFVDSASLVAQADLFVGVGGTITREAALQGTPAIIVKAFSDQYVNDFLAQEGFPLFKVELSDTLKLAQRLIGEKHRVKHLLDKLENPVDTIEKIVERKYADINGKPLSLREQ